ncbi:MAG TPA: hypothetical protein P5565_11800, partial [Bacteroidia bacterium]|nr:hypothetical protein [Bacteroidia bacterium]
PAPEGPNIIDPGDQSHFSAPEERNNCGLHRTQLTGFRSYGEPCHRRCRLAPGDLVRLMQSNRITPLI